MAMTVFEVFCWTYGAIFVVAGVVCSIAGQRLALMARERAPK